MENFSIADLYETERPKLLQYCYAITHCHDDAEDVLQEAFLRLSAQVHVKHPTPYLYRLAYTIGIGLLKQKAKHCEYSLNCHDMTISEPDALYGTLHKAIKTLPCKEGLAIWLFYWEKLSQREIAHKMETTEGYVEQLLFRAKKHLREMLKNEN